MKMGKECFQGCQCFITSIYFTRCHIDVNIAAKAQGPQHEPYLFRSQWAFSMPPFLVWVACLLIFQQDFLAMQDAT